MYVVTNIHMILRLKTDQPIYKYEYNNLNMTSIDPSKTNVNGGAVYMCVVTNIHIILRLKTDI
jgi:hypothetical protein